MFLAWVIALPATAGALFLGEVMGVSPCLLCWYQRIAMYPLAVILGIGALRGDLGARLYALPLAVVGAVIALIQNLEDWGLIPVLKACTADATTVACDIPWPLWGSGALAGLNTVLTIPVLSMTAFILIIGLLAWGRPRSL